MKYRAILIDPSATRETKPEQSLSDSPAILEEWAIQTLSGRPNKPGYEVHIMRTVEQPFRVISVAHALQVIEERIEAETQSNAAAARSKQLGMPPDAHKA